MKDLRLVLGAMHRITNAQGAQKLFLQSLHVLLDPTLLAMSVMYVRDGSRSDSVWKKRSMGQGWGGRARNIVARHDDDDEVGMVVPGRRRRAPAWAACGG